MINSGTRRRCTDHSSYYHNRFATSWTVLCLLSVTFTLFSSSPSPFLLSCLFDSAKFRAVTLSEGFWQRSTVVEDWLPLHIPCCENPGRAALRSLRMTCAVAEPVAIVHSCVLCCCLCISHPLPDLLRQKCCKCSNMLFQCWVRKTSNWFHSSLCLFLAHIRYPVTDELQQQISTAKSKDYTTLLLITLTTGKNF